MSNSGEQQMTDILSGAESGSEDTSKFLTFTVDQSHYGVDILSVREIKGWEQPTGLPNTPDYVDGVINLRGIVVPIFDLRKRFSIGQTEPNPKNVIIILATEDDNKMIGILVDAVSDILDANQQDIKDAPKTEMNVDDKYVKGIVAQDSEMIVLLDTNVLFRGDDLQATYDSIEQSG